MNEEALNHCGTGKGFEDDGEIEDWQSMRHRVTAKKTRYPRTLI